MNDLNFIARKLAKKHGSPTIRVTVVVFGISFLVLLAILNSPLIVSAIQYPLQHNDTTDNERLTEQYRALYGYAQHPELQSLGQPNEALALSIPKLGVTAPVILPGSSREEDILGALTKGVALYPGSVMPGTPSTAAIVGHSSSNFPWTKYSTIFVHLDKLTPDDLVSIRVRDQEYTYRVVSIEKGSIQELLNAGLHGDLILSSCWPAGTDEKRIVVTATLIAVR